MADTEKQISAEDLSLLGSVDEGAGAGDKTETKESAGTKADPQAKDASVKDVSDDKAIADDKSTSGKDAKPADAAAKDKGEAAKPKTTGKQSLIDAADGEDEEPAADDEPKGDDKATSGKDAKARPKTGKAWEDVRASAIDREMKRLEASLGKTLTASELPKELAKRKAALEKTLSRFSSVEDALISGFNANEKIRSGQLKAPFPSDGTDEEQAAWRQQNGIPVEAKAYEVPKVAGYTWGEGDEPVIASFKEAAFEAHMTQEHMNRVMGWYGRTALKLQEEQAELITKMDKEDTDSASDVLRDHFGKGEFRPSMALMSKYLYDESVFPDGLGERLAQARFPDGHRVINEPGIAKYLVESAKGHYGEGAMISGDQQTAFTSEIAELEKLMNTDIDTYNYQPWRSTGMTASQRYLELKRQEAARSGGRGKAA